MKKYKPSLMRSWHSIFQRSTPIGIRWTFLLFLDDCQIQGHEVDESTGDSLVFLKSSLLFCSPELGVMRHYPRSLVHCFIEDKRPEKNSENELLFRGELFSVTPEAEQLCWVRDCTNDHEIPTTQSIISGWMKWLNQG